MGGGNRLVLPSRSEKMVLQTTEPPQLIREGWICFLSQPVGGRPRFTT